MTDPLMMPRTDVHSSLLSDTPAAPTYPLRSDQAHTRNPMLAKYNVDNARTPEQAEYMRQLDADGVCVFCPEGASHVQQVHACAGWRVVVNRFPWYPDDRRRHFLLVPDDHLVAVDELGADEWLAMRHVLRWTLRHHLLRDYRVTVRSGDMAATGGTIQHLHAHLVGV